MDDTTLFGGLARTGGAGGGARSVAAGAARRFEVSVSFVIKLVQRWRREGTIAPEPYGGWKRPTLAAHAERVHELLRGEPGLTIAELRSRLAAEAIFVSPAAISRFLTVAGLTRKKRRSTQPSRSGRTSPRRGPSGATDSRN